MPKLRDRPEVALSKSVSKSLKKAMIDKEWNQEHTAKICGLTQCQISRIINNPLNAKLYDLVIVSNKLGIKLLEV